MVRTSGVPRAFSTGAKTDLVKATEEGEIIPVDLISGVPPEISRRKVRIYRPANTPTQSGSARPNHWKIDFDVKGPLGEPFDGLGYADPVQALQVKFLTKEDAILFAERQGYDYWIDLPKEGRFAPQEFTLITSR
ncbi:ETC complex I subunit conserved region-domain-containing protein [Chytridium lagenaria]|nr:ETC complex I subunit conserved region-domain-containing protein [Chytridium lagenaria]